MERTRLAELIAFDERRLAKHRVFEPARPLTDLYCLDPGQEQLLHVHEGSDKVLVVMAGRVLVRVDDDRAEAGQDGGGGGRRAGCWSGATTTAPRPASTRPCSSPPAPSTPSRTSAPTRRCCWCSSGPGWLREPVPASGWRGSS